jgi:hypothetical protein
MEDVENAASDLPLDKLWLKPGGAASVGYHILHLTGSTDRLLTYARGERLSPEQKEALSAESSPPQLSAPELIAQLRSRIDSTLGYLGQVRVDSLYDERSVGRAGLPTTVIGLLFHAAEHSQRHAGQLVTTAKIVRAMP